MSTNLLIEQKYARYRALYGLTPRKAGSTASATVTYPEITAIFTKLLKELSKFKTKLDRGPKLELQSFIRDVDELYQQFDTRGAENQKILQVLNTIQSKLDDLHIAGLSEVLSSIKRSMQQQSETRKRVISSLDKHAAAAAAANECSGESGEEHADSNTALEAYVSSKNTPDGVGPDQHNSSGERAKDGDDPSVAPQGSQSSEKANSQAEWGATPIVETQSPVHLIMGSYGAVFGLEDTSGIWSQEPTEMHDRNRKVENNLGVDSDGESDGAWSSTDGDKGDARQMPPF